MSHPLVAGENTIERSKIMGGVRAWIFRALILAAAGLFLYVWFMPWWNAYIVALDTTAINIYVFGLESFIPEEHIDWISGYNQAMPGWFTPVMWVYLGLVVAILLFSMFASSKKGISLGKFRISLPTTLIGGVGLSMIAVCIIGIIVILMNLKIFFDAPLNGTFIVDMGDAYHSSVDTKLMMGYYLFGGIGAGLLVLSMIRQFIVGKNKA
jgi:hypothetical protein